MGVWATNSTPRFGQTDGVSTQLNQCPSVWVCFKKTKEYQWNPEKLIISCVENLQFLEVRLQLCHISPGSPFYSQEHQLGPRGSTRKIVHHILSAWGGGGWYIQDVPSRSYGEQGEISPGFFGRSKRGLELHHRRFKTVGTHNGILFGEKAAKKKTGIEPTRKNEVSWTKDAKTWFKLNQTNMWFEKSVILYTTNLFSGCAGNPWSTHVIPVLGLSEENLCQFPSKRRRTY